MRITFADVAEHFEGILAGRVSRDQADRWAAHVCDMLDNGTLEFFPAADEPRIWAGVGYLHGIDIPNPENNEFLYSDDDVRWAFEKIVNGHPLTR